MSKLIGTNPNQVPSNADLGTAAFMDKKEFLLSKGSEMSAIEAVIPKTALDVFVYDTTKDSDGGEWRKRVQHTSWYNEKLNTTTRGSRKEFPSVAVIVVRNTEVTIYDGNDPTLPMWMVFDGTAYSMISNTNNGITGTTMKDGNLVVISTSGYNHGGVSVINFISDYAYLKTAGYTKENDTGIVNRGNAFYGTAGSSYIVNNNVRDVAITLFPNAPIDSVTGLPVPTIAIATDGGVSVIKDDGIVVNLTYQISTDREADNVNFTDTGGIGHTTRDGRVYYAEYDTIPTNDTTAVYDTSLSPGQTTASQTLTRLLPRGNLLTVVNAGTKRYIGIDPATYSGIAGGLSVLDIERASSAVNGYNLSVAHIMSDYNTGWMHGDIKLATLSDTDTTNATESEFVANGTFASNTASWTAQSGATISRETTVFSGGGLKLLSDGTAGANAIQSVSGLTVGKTYVVSTKVYAPSSNNGTNLGAIGFATNDGINRAKVRSENTIQTISFTFVATNTSQNIMVMTLGPAWGSNGDYSVFDDISVSLAEEDRRVEDNGLQVFGTIHKTPVATGAELVAYSGFTSGQFTGNRLEQPYNSDLAFGTGDFSINFWIKNVDDGYDIMGIGKRNSNFAWTLYKDAGGGLRYTFSTNGTSSSGLIEYQFGDDGTIPNWTSVNILRRSGVFHIYINGKLEETLTGNETASLYDPQEPLVIGSGNTNNSTDSSVSLALLRISATAPTSEQIAKMYNDERFLFQENAKCTLYGTSDKVNALAYDDDTELLHVGTGAGRSDFQGLRRINNTTRAIGTAISAVDGFIVEE